MIERRTQGRIPPNLIPSQKAVETIVKTVFRTEKKRLTGDLAVIFTDGPTIKKINKRFLNHKGETDVIAFPYLRPPGVSEGPVGDVYVCVAEAKRNAERFDEPVRRELVRLVVHGTLHLLGYDDHDPADKKAMWSRQETLVRSLWSKRKF